MWPKYFSLRVFTIASSFLFWSVRSRTVLLVTCNMITTQHTPPRIPLTMDCAIGLIIWGALQMLLLLLLLYTSARNMNLASEWTRVHYQMKLQQNFTSSLQVMCNLLIQRIQNSCQGQRSKSNVAKISSLPGSSTAHVCIKVQQFWSIVFSFCADRQTERQTHKRRRNNTYFAQHICS